MSFLYGNGRGLGCWVTIRYDRGSQFPLLGGPDMSVSDRWRARELFAKYLGFGSCEPLLLLLLLITAIELSLGGSIPYTSTGKTNKNKYT
jgi:hypothetical protein